MWVEKLHNACRVFETTANNTVYACSSACKSMISQSYIWGTKVENQDLRAVPPVEWNAKSTQNEEGLKDMKKGHA